MRRHELRVHNRSLQWPQGLRQWYWWIVMSGAAVCIVSVQVCSEKKCSCHNLIFSIYRDGTCGWGARSKILNKTVEQIDLRSLFMRKQWQLSNRFSPPPLPTNSVLLAAPKRFPKNSGFPYSALNRGMGEEDVSVSRNTVEPCVLMKHFWTPISHFVK